MTLLGKTVGRLRVLSLLGRGGMGEVYVAHDETLDRRVALKSIAADRRLEPWARARFLREARALSRLDHPNICRIYDYVEEGTQDFLVLELVTGRSLDTAIRAGLGRDRQLRVAEQIAAALVAAHAEGIVHRDLKPGNVMLADSGEVKVLDFGLAWTAPSRSVPRLPVAPAAAPSPPDLPPTEAGFGGARETLGVPSWLASAAEPVGAPFDESVEAPDPEAEEDAALTRRGVAMGTPSYMSPEQARGEPATTASDMYALGLLLQYLFTGCPPHPEGLGSTELLVRAMRAEKLPAIGLPRDLAALVSQLEAAAPAARPTAVEVAARLAWIRDAPKRRWRRALAAAAFLLVVAAGVKYTLDLRGERSRAVAAQEEAERRRLQAEDLIQFMLGDLRERLEPVGRLDALDGVAAKALDYFGSVEAGRLTEADLFRRARALTQIGEVRIAQGDLVAAQRSLDEAHALASDLVGRRPDSGEWLMGLGAVEFWLGNVHWLQGDLARAEQRFEAYLDVANRLVAIDGTKAEWRLEQAYAHGNLGAVQNARGDADAALSHFRLTVDVHRQLVEAEPDEPRWRKDLAGSLSWLGEALLGRGELAEARVQYEAGRDVLGQLVVLAPEDTGNRFLLGIAHVKVGTALEYLGLRDDALAEYRHGLAIHRQLQALDPGNADWRREAAVSQWRLGAAEVGTAAAGALAHLRLAAGTLAELQRSDPTNAERRLDHARARLELGRGLLASGQIELAVAEVRAALAGLGEGGANADDRARRLLAGELGAVLGDASSAAGRRREARAAWTDATSALAPLAGDGHDPRVLAPLVQALLALGQEAEARPFVERLQASGYRRTIF